MELLGNANWWLPRWLSRALPHVDVDGGADATGDQVEDADERELVGADR